MRAQAKLFLALVILAAGSTFQSAWTQPPKGENAEAGYAPGVYRP